MSRKRVKVEKFIDPHTHMREGEVTELILPYSARYCDVILAVGNTSSPTSTPLLAQQYYDHLRRVAEKTGHGNLTIWVAPMVTPDTTPEMVEKFARLSFVKSLKTMPRAGTTNSHQGIPDFLDPKYVDVTRAMRDNGLVSMLHATHPPAYIMDEEKTMVPVLEQLVEQVQGGLFSVEHIGDGAIMDFVLAAPDTVVGTVAPQHLKYTTDAVLKGKLHPHAFCMPVLKRPEDQEALWKPIASGNKKIWYGSDTAYHPKDKKESAEGCPGAFNAPVAPELLVEMFEERGLLDRLSGFVAGHAAAFYGLELSGRTITFEKESFKVPAELVGAVPFMHGEKISWSVVSE